MDTVYNNYGTIYFFVSLLLINFYSMKRNGILIALGTALVSGISIFVNRFAVDSISPPLLFTAVKNLGVGFFIISGLLAFGKLQKFLTLTPRERVLLFAVALVGGTIPFYLFFTGLSMIPAVNAGFIHKSLVLWVSILAFVFLKERLSKTMVLAVLVLFSANYVIPGFTGFQFSIGELMVLGATLFWSVETIIAKKALKTIDPDLLTAARMGVGSVVLFVAAVVTAPAAVGGLAKIAPMQLFWFSLTMLTLLAYVSTWYRALALAPATTVSAVLVASTLVTNILSAVFVTHAWSMPMTLQGIITVAGIGIVWYASRQTSREKNIAPASAQS